MSVGAWGESRRRTHVSVAEVPDVAVERHGLAGDRGQVSAFRLEVGRVLLEDGLVVPEVLELPCKFKRGMMMSDDIYVRTRMIRYNDPVPGGLHYWLIISCTR